MKRKEHLTSHPDAFAMLRVANPFVECSVAFVVLCERCRILNIVNGSFTYYIQFVVAFVWCMYLYVEFSYIAFPLLFLRCL